MSTYTSFAVIGSGYIGDYILSALVTESSKAKVIALSRNPDAKKLPSGVTTVKVNDYTDTAALSAVFKEHSVEVVVSTVGHAGIEAQAQIADAAKAAGVELFVPSEFGSPTEGITAAEYPLFHPKEKIAQYLKSIGLPSLRIFTGGFIRRGLVFVTGVDANGKINIVGKGLAPASWTAEEDIGGFVAHVLTHVNGSELSNRILRVEGDRASLVDIAKKFGKDIEYVETVPGSASERRTLLSKAFDTGIISTGWDNSSKTEGKGEAAAGGANDLWKGHQWKKLTDVFQTL